MGSFVFHQVEMPEEFDCDDFRELWAEWEQHRIERRCKLTPTARRRQLLKLGRWGYARAIRALSWSLDQGYQGLFEPKEGPSDGDATPSRHW